jgi:glycosyltransferase involved in cell wall biosynthesis/putative flippase GtrA
MAAFVRFCIVGAICTLLNLLAFWILVGRAGLGYLGATVVVFFVVNWVGFALNRGFTFGRREAAPAPQALRYFTGMALSLALNLAAMWVLVDRLGIHYLAASLVVTVVFVCLNFVMHRDWTFSDRGRDAPSSEAGAAPLLLVTHYYPAHGGGVEIVAGQIARRLAPGEPFGVEWWASAVDEPPAHARVTCRPVTACNALERVGLPIPLWGPAALWRLFRRTRQARLVHVHDLLYPGNLVAALGALAHSRPLLVTQHLGLVPYRSRVLRGAMSLANRVVVAPLLARAGAVAFVADAPLHYFSRWCRWQRPPTIVRNGVDTELFRPPSADERAAAREALALPPGRQACLFVGRFVEKKGLEALRRFAGRTRPLAWLFAGRGPLDPADWGVPNVAVFRDRSEVSLRELYWAADVLVLPSVGEGFPLVVQEAMSCGLAPVVTVETAAGCEAATEELATLDSGAPDSDWVDLIRRLCEAESMSRRTRIAAFARKLWSWDAASAEYSQLIRELTQRSTAGR